MATIEISNRKRKAGVKRISKKSTSIDLTPMVDLGFLLLTFFVFTTSMIAPNALAVNIPKDEGDPTAVCNSCALTLIPGANNKIYYYEGAAANHPRLDSTSFAPDGIRALILRKKTAIRMLNDPEKELVLAIKPSRESSYKNFVDLMDEVEINAVKHYFIASFDKDDKKLFPDTFY